MVLSILKTTLVSVLAFASTSVALQLPLGAESPLHSYEVSLGLGGEGEKVGLQSLSTDDFTTFEHPSIPNYKLRIKAHDDFCETKARSYTGWIDTMSDTQHIFFYFFESRHKPSEDPVIMWLNGGPGSSSALGLFMELGPCRVNEEGNATSWNEYSWNDKANVFFVDQPVGVGFSYSDHNITVHSTEDAAPVIQQFVTLFFEAFPSFKGRPFHMTGESYGGKYVPMFSAAILDGNIVAKSKGLTPINLQSVAIGNGMISAFSMFPTQYDMVCTSVSLPPLMSIAECIEMKRGMPLCLKRIREDCEDRHDAIACPAAAMYCFGLVSGIVASGVNPYDISKRCVDPENDVCYTLEHSVEKYLNVPSVKKTLGIPSGVEYKMTNYNVNMGFTSHGDFFRTSDHHVAGLLERGVRVLLYDGTYDLVCNHVGYLKAAHSLEWTGQEEFAKATMRDWSVEGSLSGKRAGETKSSKALLHWATVEGAGHLVPYDKPVEALHMINKWIANEDL